MALSDQARAMAHLRDLAPYRCESCLNPAKVELVNGVNATVGRYCRACGKRALRAFKAGR